MEKQAKSCFDCAHSQYIDGHYVAGPADSLGDIMKDLAKEGWLVR